MEENQQDMVQYNHTEIVVEIHLKEFEKLREDMGRILGDQQQTMVLVLGSASIFVPLLASQTSAMSVNLIAGVLYSLVIVYSLIGINYAVNLYHIAMIGTYIHRYIEPKVNQLILDNSKPVLYWESYLRKERTQFPDLFLAGSHAITSVLLLLLPSIFSLLTAHSILKFPEIANASEIVLRMSQLWIPILSFSAWLLFAMSIAAFIFAVIYHAIKAGSF